LSSAADKAVTDIAITANAKVLIFFIGPPKNSELSISRSKDTAVQRPGETYDVWE
jgi:hypothetical protein